MKDLFQYNSIESFFQAIYKELKKKEKRKKVVLTREWAKQFDKQKGVYFIFEKDELKYVGETGSISGRMRDLLNTKNHTLRRSLGARLFSKESSYENATSSKSFSPVIEDKLNSYIQKHLTVSTVSIEIGRKEFEEWVMESNPNIVFYNIRKKRKT